MKLCSVQDSHCCRPNLSVGEHDLHLGNIICGGHRKYDCRSIDTDYQKNCIAVTMFLRTYVYVMRTLSVKSQSSVYCTENLITTGSLALPVCCVLRLAPTEASNPVYPEPALGWLPHQRPPHKTDVLLVSKSWLL